MRQIGCENPPRPALVEGTADLRRVWRDARVWWLGAAIVCALAPPSPAWTQAAQPSPARASPGAGPVVVVETIRGTFEFETYPNEAPKTVARILELVKKRFYNGLRVHRVEPNFVVQLGDPTTRDMTKEADWGRMGSGTPIGVGEITKTRTHVRGAVAMAHAGDPSKADSQFYITLSPQPTLNGKYTVFGRVIGGMDVVGKLQVTDRIIRMTVRPET